MELSVALLLFMYIIIFLWQMKADMLFLLVAFGSFIFFILFTLLLNPIGSIVSIVNFFIANPLIGIILLISPLGVYGIINKIKKNRAKRQKLME